MGPRKVLLAAGVTVAVAAASHVSASPPSHPHASTTPSASAHRPAAPPPRAPAGRGAPRGPARYRLPRGYGEMVRHWHAPKPGVACPTSPEGRPLLVLDSINWNEHVELRPERDDGGFGASDLDRAAHVLRDPRTGNEYPVDPRLLDLVYRIQRHFDAQEIRVVSGYRTPQHAGRSNHGRGRAMDMIVPGATDDEVATFARTIGYVGVGIYPTSGFVHVDSRPKSYFWVDASGPGQKNRTSGILAGLAAESDAKAAQRGDRPPPAWAVPAGDFGAASQLLAQPAADPNDAEDEEGEAIEGAGG